MSRRSTPRKSRAAANPQHPQPPLRERREPVPSALPQRRGFWLVPALIALVTFAAFLPVLQNQFVDWDDQRNFLDNHHYRGLGWTHLRWMWTTHLGHYIPLTWMTLGLDYLLWGMNPVGYHLTNLLPHAANAVVFFFVVRRILTLALPSPAERSHALAVSAGFAALVFAIHPLRVESVAWVTERRDVLSGLFYLLTILVYLRASERGARCQGWYWLSVAAFVCALLSKSMVVNLSPLYELPPTVNPWAPPFIVSYGVVVAITALVLALRRRVPGLPAAWLAYVVVLLPVLGIFQSGPQIAADRYTYLAGLGWAILAGAGLLSCWRSSRRSKTGTPATWLLASLALCVVVGLGVLNWNQVQVWHDSETLWTHALSIDPQSPIAHNDWGTALARQGRLAKASEHYRQALEIRPDYAPAHNNWGTALAQQGRLAEAIEHFRQALRLEPNFVDAHYNLGMALAQQGKLAEASEHYRQTLQSKPDYADAHNNLGAALAQQGKLAEAIEHFRQALRLKPDFPDAHNNLGAALAQQQGKLADLVERYGQAVRLKVDDAATQSNLLDALRGLGTGKEHAAHGRKGETAE